MASLQVSTLHSAESVPPLQLLCRDIGPVVWGATLQGSRDPAESVPLQGIRHEEQ